MTPFSQDNQDFSNLAHQASVEQVYPFAFDVEAKQLSFENTGLSTGDRGKILDGEMGVDRIARISVPDLKQPIVHTIQERFRDTKFSKYKDLTITEWNSYTRKPSELYKINAGFFLYAFFDKDNLQITDWVFVNTSAMLLAISNESLQYERRTNPRSGQTFICISFRSLYDCNCLVAYNIDGKTSSKRLQSHKKTLHASFCKSAVHERTKTRCVQGLFW